MNSDTNLWAITDFPPRDAFRAAFLIDGRMTMLEMCVRFLNAKKSIHIAAWGLTPDLLMVRGKHQRAGKADSPEQQELRHWLREKGLSEDDLLFWCSSETLSVTNVFKYVRAKGVDIRVLLWDAYTLPFHIGPKQVKEQLEAVGVVCLLDDSHKSLAHPIESLHQKTVTIDGRYAFVGGIDLMTRGDGEFDRWDTKGHPYHSILRLNKDGLMPHSWHDVQVLFEGPPVTDVEENFCQRWSEVAARQNTEARYQSGEAITAIALPDAKDVIHMQVTRTIPPQTYSFAAEGIASTLESYQKAFEQAQHFIYLENQYFWRRTFLGIENPLLGVPHADMERLFQALIDALARGVIVVLVLPDHPNVGRDFTDDGLRFLWEIAPQAINKGTLQVYTLGTSLRKDEQVLYRPIYVHAKVAIVDDQWLTVGSANLNNRGMRDDAELNVAVLHPQMARGLRMLLMAEHLGLCNEDTLFQIIEVMGRTHPSDELGNLRGDLGNEWARLQVLLRDPYTAVVAYLQQAKDNLAAVRAQKTLKGHLLPYIRHDLAGEYGLRVDAVSGWLDQLARPLKEEELSTDEEEHSLSRDEILSNND